MSKHRTHTRANVAYVELNELRTVHTYRSASTALHIHTHMTLHTHKINACDHTTHKHTHITHTHTPHVHTQHRHALHTRTCSNTTPLRKLRLFMSGRVPQQAKKLISLSTNMSKHQNTLRELMFAYVELNELRTVPRVGKLLLPTISSMTLQNLCCACDRRRVRFKLQPKNEGSKKLREINNTIQVSQAI